MDSNKCVYNINTKEWEIADEKAKLPNQSDKVSYYIYNRGMRNFKPSMKYIADDMVFFDIETAPWDVKFSEEGNIDYLKLDTLQFTCFSLIFGKNYKIDMLDIVLEIEKELANVDKTIMQRANGISVYCESPKLLLTTMLIVLALAQKKNKRKMRLCGHNSLKFDSYLFNHTPGWLEPKTDTRVEAKEKIVSWVVDNRTYEVTICDTLQMAKAFGCPTVKDMGEMIGMPKLSRSANDSKEAYAEYCLRDSQIVYQFVKQEVNGNDIFDLNPARHSRKHFYHCLFSDKKNLECISTSSNINRFQARAARVEAYKKEVDSSYYLDANSLYPTVQTTLDMAIPEEHIAMDKKKMPKINEDGELIKRWHYSLTSILPKAYVTIRMKLWNMLDEIKALDGITPAKLKNIYDSYFNDKFYLIKVKIHGIREDFGSQEQIDRLLFYFPFVLKKGDRTIFRFIEGEEYQVGFYELLFLSFFNYEIVEAYEMKKGQGIFKPYIEELYNQRRAKKDKGEDGKFEKLVLNSGGYGIFIIKNRETKKIENSEVYKFFSEDKEGIAYKENIKKFAKREITLDTLNTTTPRYYKIGNRVFEPKFNGDDVYSIDESPQQWIENSIPILGLNILSNSRFFMYSFYLNAIFNPSYEIYYTDTDSLFCNKSLYEFIQENGYEGKNLGQFKLEYNVDKAFFLAPKAYVTLHREANGEMKVSTTIKGTGESFVRTIVANQKFKSTMVYQRLAFNPNTIQKRRLEGEWYINEFSDGDPDKWEKQYEEFMDKVVEFYKTAIDHNKRNGFYTEDYERNVSNLLYQISEINHKKMV